MKKLLSLLSLFFTSLLFSQTLIKTYYDTYSKTKLKEVYQVKPNTQILNGYYKFYDVYGNLLEHGNYINNKLNGKLTKYVGAYQATITYGGINSLGKISSISNYKNGLKDGETLSYNFSENGKHYLEFKQTYKNDILISNIIYFSNGQEKKNLKIGKSFEYYENGKKFAEYIINEDEQIEGEYLGWSENGFLEIKGFFLNGKKDGKWITFNNDGTIKSEELYELGSRIQTEKEKKQAQEIELEKLKKEEENRKILEEKLLAKQKEEEKIKKIEEEKIALINKIKKLIEIFENKFNSVKELYVVEDKPASLLFNQRVYKTKKKNLYHAYVSAVNFLNSEMTNESNLNVKSEFLNLGIKLSEKMVELKNTDTKDLEKRLKNTEKAIEIIEILGLKK